MKNKSLKSVSNPIWEKSFLKKITIIKEHVDFLHWLATETQSNKRLKK